MAPSRTSMFPKLSLSEPVCPSPPENSQSWLTGFIRLANRPIAHARTPAPSPESAQPLTRLRPKTRLTRPFTHNWRHNRLNPRAKTCPESESLNQETREGAWPLARDGGASLRSAKMEWPHIGGHNHRPLTLRSRKRSLRRTFWMWHPLCG